MKVNADVWKDIYNKRFNSEYCRFENKGHEFDAIYLSELRPIIDSLLQTHTELQERNRELTADIKLAKDALNKMKQYVGKTTEFGKLIDETLFYLGTQRLTTPQPKDT